MLQRRAMKELPKGLKIHAKNRVLWFEQCGVCKAPTVWIVQRDPKFGEQAFFGVCSEHLERPAFAPYIAYSLYKEALEHAQQIEALERG